MKKFLLSRWDRPFWWAAVFAAYGAVAGAVAGFRQEGLNGALLGAAVAAIIGATVGLLFGTLVRGLAWVIGGLNRPVRNPGRWGFPLQCASCGWRTRPDGPWTIRDCLSPPTRCPLCRQNLQRVVAACPDCGVVERWRRPKSREQALWGGATCSACGCAYDKWGRCLDG